jgi:hypothetical protein
MPNNHQPSYVALVAALRAEFNDLSLEAIKIRLSGYRYTAGSIGVLAQAVIDACDIAYDTGDDVHVGA